MINEEKRQLLFWRLFVWIRGKTNVYTSGFWYVLLGCYWVEFAILCSKTISQFAVTDMGSVLNRRCNKCQKHFRQLIVENFVKECQENIRQHAERWFVQYQHSVPVLLAFEERHQSSWSLNSVVDSLLFHIPKLNVNYICNLINYCILYCRLWTVIEHP